MIKGGRPKDPVWGFFQDTGGKTNVHCKRCLALVSKKADRYRTHLKKCEPVIESPLPWLPMPSVEYEL